MLMPVGEFWTTLPPMTDDGVLPWLPAEGHIKSMLHHASPYFTNICEVERVFGYNSHRVQLLGGLISFQRALLSIGYSDGFHWIGGSFVGRYCETPKDLDVVTFLRRPVFCKGPEEYLSFKSKNSLLHNKMNILNCFGIDNTYVDLSPDFQNCPEYHYIRSIVAFYSLFSNCEISKKRKGFVCVALGPDE